MLPRWRQVDLLEFDKLRLFGELLVQWETLPQNNNNKLPKTPKRNKQQQKEASWYFLNSKQTTISNWRKLRGGSWSSPGKSKQLIFPGQTISSKTCMQITIHGLSRTHYSWTYVYPSTHMCARTLKKEAMNLKGCGKGHMERFGRREGWNVLIKIHQNKHTHKRNGSQYLRNDTWECFLAFMSCAHIHVHSWAHMHACTRAHTQIHTLIFNGKGEIHMVDKHGLVALRWEIQLFATRMEQEECFEIPDVRSSVLGKPPPPHVILSRASPAYVILCRKEWMNTVKRKWADKPRLQTALWWTEQMTQTFHQHHELLHKTEIGKTYLNWKQPTKQKNQRQCVYIQMKACHFGDNYLDC